MALGESKAAIGELNRYMPSRVQPVESVRRRVIESRGARSFPAGGAGSDLEGTRENSLATGNRQRESCRSATRRYFSKLRKLRDGLNSERCREKSDENVGEGGPLDRAGGGEACKRRNRQKVQVRLRRRRLSSILPPAALLAVTGTPVSKIGPQDVLRIDVWNKNQISRSVPVRPDGKISLPLLNDAQVAVRTSMELANTITEGLKKFINSPQVTVTVTEINSRRVYVTGE